MPITNDRLINWIESSTNGEKSSVDTIVKFLQYFIDENNHDHIVSMINPLSSRNLITSVKLEDFRQCCEFACFTIVEHLGDVLKLLKLPTKTRKVKIDRKFLRPEMAYVNKKQEKQLILNVRSQAVLEEHQSVNLEIVIKGQFYFMLITSSDHDTIMRIKKAFEIVQEIEITKRGTKYIKLSNYIENASVIIPEFSFGPQTRVSFLPFTGKHIQHHHAGITTAVINVQKSNLNVDWKITEYAKYAEKFSQQIGEYQKLISEDEIKVRQTDRWRFYGKMSESK